jgi:hypothetical protein
MMVSPVIENLDLLDQRTTGRSRQQYDLPKSPGRFVELLTRQLV